MYPTTTWELGRFSVSLFDREDWIPLIQYFPEPPVAVRGGNPWQQERQRILWTAENAAWKEIQSLQRIWSAQTKHMAYLVDQYNTAVRAIEERLAKLGRPSPFKKLGMVGGVLSLTPFSVAGTIMTVMAGIDQLVDLISGKTRKLKRDVENWMNTLSKIDGMIRVQEQAMAHTASLVKQQLAVRDQVASQQAAAMALDVAKSEAHYMTRQARAAEHAAAHSAMAAVARQAYTQKRDHDVL